MSTISNLLMMLVCTALSNGDQTDDGDHISEEAEYPTIYHEFKEQVCLSNIFAWIEEHKIFLPCTRCAILCGFGLLQSVPLTRTHIYICYRLQKLILGLLNLKKPFLKSTHRGPQHSSSTTTINTTGSNISKQVTALPTCR